MNRRAGPTGPPWLGGPGFANLADKKWDGAQHAQVMARGPAVVGEMTWEAEGPGDDKPVGERAAGV